MTSFMSSHGEQGGASLYSGGMAAIPPGSGPRGFGPQPGPHDPTGGIAPANLKIR